MGIIVSKKEVVRQSNQVFNQFGDKWKLFSRYNVRLPRRNINELQNSGIGKTLLCAAMGESLEDSIPLIKANRHKFDLLTCDKGFGTLLEHGIKADYVMICDCNIPFRWFKPYVNESKGVKLISTLYASPRWTSKWKGDRYFYVNRDAINSQKIFGPMLPPGELRTIPAGSNVSNAMVVFFTGSDETQNVNWSGYERYLLVGYDYSWRHDGNYYAFANPRPKRFYMNHRTVVGTDGRHCLTSENLFFSAKWFYSYMTMHKLPIINCSGRGILDANTSSLEKELEMINDDPLRKTIVRQFFDVAVETKKSFDMASKSFEESRRLVYGTGS